jgi:outer membrane protein assembly factor BamA
MLFLALMIPSPAAGQSGQGTVGVQRQEASEEPASRGGWFPLPIIYYTPETRMAVGAAVQWVFYPGDNKPSRQEEPQRPSTLLPVFIYTQNRQKIAELNADVYSGNGAWRLTGFASYVKFPSKYYGIGPDAVEEDEEELTRRFTTFRTQLLRRLRPGLRVGVHLEYIRSRVVELEVGSLLARGSVPGSGSGTATGAGLLIHWDTRDNIFSPSSGSFHQVNWVDYAGAWGSDYEFTDLRIDLRRYVRLKSDHVLALQAIVASATGQPPFYKLQKIGGPLNLRGYYEGRYRDRALVQLQAEYRLHLTGRIGMAGFIGLGQVGDRLGDIDLGDPRYAGGLGVRWAFNPAERLNLRLDMGFAPGSSGMYITMGEAF